MQLYRTIAWLSTHMQIFMDEKCSFKKINTFMHTWFRSIWVLREPFLVEEHCTGTIWPLVSEHSHFHTTSHPLVNKIHYLSYSDHRLKTIMSNIIVYNSFSPRQLPQCHKGSYTYLKMWTSRYTQPGYNGDIYLCSTATSEHNMSDYEICSSPAWPWADTEVQGNPYPSS